MKPRDHAMLAIFIGPFAALADEVSSFVLLRHTYVVTVIAGVATLAAMAASYRIFVRRSEVFQVDRFLALFGLCLNSFCLFVVLFGFGIPKLVLHPTD